MLEVPAAAGDHPAIWGGTDWTGAVLPEGEYDLRLYESTGGSGESIFENRHHRSHVTAGQHRRIEPGVFSPGWPDTSASVKVYFNVSGLGDRARRRG